MERPLQLPFDSFVVCIIRSFNPCFYGTTSSTLNSFWGLQSFMEGFNPCFYGTTSSTRLYSAEDTGRISFQSLFLWNDLFNEDMANMTPEDSACFNPCFYGTTSSTFVAFFTSLASTSFNPCFYGTTSSTKGRKTQMATLVRFQSLFLWNDLFNEIYMAEWGERF